MMIVLIASLLSNLDDFTYLLCFAWGNLLPYPWWTALVYCFLLCWHFLHFWAYTLWNIFLNHILDGFFLVCILHLSSWSVKIIVHWLFYLSSITDWKSSGYFYMYHVKNSFWKINFSSFCFLKCFILFYFLTFLNIFGKNSVFGIKSLAGNSFELDKEDILMIQLKEWIN